MSWRVFSITFVLSLLGCKEEPLKEPPTPPDMEALAESFESPFGSLDEENAAALGEWLINDAGTELVLMTVLIDLILPSWIRGAEGGSADVQEESSGGGPPQLMGEGWMRISLPCTFGEGAGEGRLSFYSLFSLIGLDPTLWGTLSDCSWPEESFAISGELAFFLPRVGPPFATIDWPGPARSWISFSGDFELADLSMSGRYLSAFDETESLILWSREGARFLVAFPRVTLADLGAGGGTFDSFRLITGEDIWSCSLTELTCSTDSGEVREL